MSKPTIENQIYDALVALLRRGADGSFVLVEERRSEKYVQIGTGRCLGMDVPFVALTGEEAARAFSFFKKLGEPAPREYRAPDPKTGTIHHGATFYHDFGQDIHGATKAVVAFFREVYQIPPGEKLSIVEH